MGPWSTTRLTPPPSRQALLPERKITITSAVGQQTSWYVSNVLNIDFSARCLAQSFSLASQEFERHYRK